MHHTEDEVVMHHTEDEVIMHHTEVTTKSRRSHNVTTQMKKVYKNQSLVNITTITTHDGTSSLRSRDHLQWRTGAHQSVRSGLFALVTR